LWRGAAHGAMDGWMDGHSFKDHILGFKMTPKAWFYLPFDKVMSVQTLEAINSRKTN